MSDGASSPAVTVEMVKRHDKPGPRYTSYPTANLFADDVGHDQYAAGLARADDQADEPLSLYLHLPFCRKRCSFCACNVVVTQRADVVERYLGYLAREIDLVARHLPNRRRVIQYHWGGGTPTHLTLEQVQALQSVVTERFDVAPDAEVAIEVHPPVTTHEQIDLLCGLGFNRLSMGVQDFDPAVQDLINRDQSEEQTREIFGYSREAGFESINVDLVYGLPSQSLDSFRRTIGSVIEMRPERVACYSYAFVPWIKPHQKAITEDMLPPAELKIELFLTARQMFLDAGYAAIGMDHFAVPEDELALAVGSGSLHRNFMGYTTRLAPDMIACGISGIGDVSGTYAQITKKLNVHRKAIDADRFPIERGVVLTDDDVVRRSVITSLMCNMRVGFADVEARHEIAFTDYFADALEGLSAPDGPVENGFVEVSPNEIVVTELGRLFIRNVAMLFDARLREQQANKPTFSRTV